MISAISKMGLMLISLIFSLSVLAQNKSVSGVVTSQEDNSLLPGVSVTVKGKSTGVQTNAEGKFKIEVTTGDVLVISYVGFVTREIIVGENNVLNIALLPAVSKLDEVVVVGYGTQKRKEVTGAVSTVSPKVFEHSPSTNVATVLQGNTPGLRVQQRTGQPGTTPTISFRGGTEFGGGGTPLFIVDGVIVPSLYGLDINDIANIDLLKDAATTAIYGARAANGVVLVTTKKGQKGKTRVTYSYSHTTNYIRRNPSEYLSAADYIRMNRLGLQARFRGDSLDNNVNAMNTDRNQLLGSWGWAVSSGWRSAEGLYTTQLLNNQNRQLLNDPRWKLLVDPNPFNPSQMDSIVFTDLSAKDREAMILQQVNTNEHNINFSGANEQGSFALSLGTVKDNGIIIGSSLKRMNMNFNGGLNVGKNLKITTNIGAYNVEQALPYGQFNSVDPEGGAAGGLLQRFVGVAPTVRYVNDTSGAILPGPNDVTLGNPLYWSNLTNNNTNQQRFLGGINLEYTVLPFLKVLASGSGYYQYTNNNFFTKAYQQGNGGAMNTNRAASFNNTKLIQYTTNAFLQFNKNFKGHNVTALAGTEFYDYKSYVNSGFSQGAPTDLIPWLTASTPPSVQGTTIVNPAGASSNFNQWERISSVIGRINYTYLNRYLLTGIVRIDGSSRLKKGNYYGTFPGVSVGWNLHNESFYKGSVVSKYLSSVKPRISYGVNGNVNSLGYFATSQVYNSAGTYNGFGGTYAASYINSDVRWERTNSLNFGADLGFLKEKITLTFDYFIRNVFDKLAGLNISSQTGFSSFTTNLGQLQNKGVEIAVNARVIDPKKADGFSLDVSVNYFHVKSFAKKLPFNGLPGNRTSGFFVWDPNNPGQQMYVGGLVEGERIGLDEVWAPQWDGIYTDQAKITGDANVYNAFLPYTNKRIKQLGDAQWHQVYKNDTIDSRQFVKVGRTTPQHTGGFNISSSYKGIRLYAGFDYAFDFVIMNNQIVRGLSQVQGSQNSTTDVLKTWSPTNPNGTMPRYYWANQGRNYATDASGNNPAANLWEKGDYVMLRELTLVYDLSSQILSKYLGNRIKGLSVNVTGTNLAYFSGYSGNFPEFGGVDQGKFPLPKRLTIGVRVTL
ncbi:MAG TPA: SusC/RagA family TonB-linked outer membrane protein [Chitinophagaceae bacterium]|nr:SusC/RagA family TonB-linked outer membrane protein [Chitinophagaceae bacterium]